jgi:hypothetical protein
MATSSAVDNYLFDQSEYIKLSLEVLRIIIFETVKEATELMQ